MSASTPAFHAREAAVLRETFGYALSYLDFGPKLTHRERDLLARLILAAARVRVRSKKALDTCIDAHILAAEVLDVFLMVQLVANDDAT